MKIIHQGSSKTFQLRVQTLDVVKLDPFQARIPWARTYFYRDKLLDNLKITDMVGADLATAQTITITGQNEAGGKLTYASR